MNTPRAITITCTPDEADWLHAAIADAQMWCSSKNTDDCEEPYLTIYPTLERRVREAIAAAEVPEVTTGTLTTHVDPAMCVCGHPRSQHLAHVGCHAPFASTSGFRQCTCKEFHSLADEDRALMDIRPPEDVEPVCGAGSAAVDVDALADAVATVVQTIGALKTEAATERQARLTLRQTVIRLGEMHRVMEILRTDLVHVRVRLTAAEQAVSQYVWRYGGTPETDPDLRRLLETRETLTKARDTATDVVSRLSQDFSTLVAETTRDE